MGRSINLYALCFGAVLFVTLLPCKGIAQSVTPATGGGAISADTYANQSFTTLNGPVLTENYAGQLAYNGTIIFNAPKGFQWDTTGTAPTVSISNSASGAGVLSTRLNIQYIARTKKTITFKVTSSSYYFTGFLIFLNTPGVATFGNFRIIPSKGTLPNSGIITNSGTTAPGGVGGAGYGQIVMVHGNTSKVLFSQEPTNATVNKAIQPSIAIQLTDQFNNPVSVAGVGVTLSLNSGTGILSGTLTQQTDTSGVAIFNNVSINSTGQKILTASSSGLSSANSSPFQILPAGQLTGFLIQSSSGGNISTQVAGQPFSIKITAVDGYGNVIQNFSGTVDITSNGIISAGGGTTANFVNGVLTSHSITMTKSGTFSITATETGSTTTGTSNTFMINPGSPDLSNSTVTASPQVILNNGTSTSTITVQLKDAYGNDLTTGGQNVQMSTTASTLSSVTDNGNGTYTAILHSTTAPVTIADITATLNGNVLSDKAQVIIAKFYTWVSSNNRRLLNYLSEQWSNPNNWNGGVVPNSQEVAYIPSSPVNNSSAFPVIETNTNVLAIIIAQGASVTINYGNTLTVGQSITGDGNLYADYANLNIGGNFTLSHFYGGTSTVVFNGSGLQKQSGSFFGGIMKIQGNNGLEADGNINVVDTLDITNSSLHLDPGSVLNAYGNIIGSGNDSLEANNSTIYVGGDLNVNHIDLSTSSITFNGNSTQHFYHVSQFKNLAINNSNNVVASGNVIVSDSLRLTKGALVIPSGANLIANSQTIGQGELQFNRIIPDSGWVMMSSPVTTSFGQFFGNKIVTQGYTGSTYPTKQPNVMTYDESYPGTDNQRYVVPADSSQTIPAGKGLFVYVFGNVPGDANYTIPTPDTLNAKGEEHQGTAGSFDFGVTYTASADTGWNLVGNPFGATINWDNTSAWTRTNMSNSIYIWDQSADSGNGAYLVWNGIIGSLGNGLIAPFQGFWVKADTTSPVLKVNPSAKTINGVFYKSSARVPVISFKLTADSLTTTSYVMFSGVGKIGKDDLDAYQLVPLTQTYLELFTTYKDGTKLNIDDLPDQSSGEMQIPVGVSGYRDGTPVSGTYTLSWPRFDNIPASWTVHLIDNKTGKTINMRNANQYSFTVQQVRAKIVSSRYGENARPLTARATSTDIRFTLKINTGQTTPAKAEIPSKYELNQNYPNPFNPTTTIRFGLPKANHVQIVVYNILGQKVAVLADKKYQAGYHQVVWNATDVASGLYLYNFRAGGKMITKKMIVIK